MTKIVKVAAAIVVANFIAFAIGTVVFGGDAVNAHRSCPPGDYLFDKHATPPCHEVSHAVYLYSLAHSCSVLVSMPILLLALLVGRYRTAAERADQVWRNGEPPH